MYKWLLLLLLGVLGCSNIHSARLNHITHQYYIPKFVHIDPAFNNRDRFLIWRSLDEWSQTTKLITWIELPWESEVAINNSYNKNIRHLIISKASKHDKVILDIEEGIGYKIDGYLWTKLGSNIQIAYIIRDRINWDLLFRLVVLHEVGHSFGLRHSHGISIMDSSQMVRAGCLTKQDLRQFCNIWDCDAEVLTPLCE